MFCSPYCPVLQRWPVDFAACGLVTSWSRTLTDRAGRRIKSSGARDRSDYALDLDACEPYGCPRTKRGGVRVLPPELNQQINTKVPESAFRCSLDAEEVTAWSRFPGILVANRRPAMVN